MLLFTFVMFIFVHDVINDAFLNISVRKAATNFAPAPNRSKFKNPPGICACYELMISICTR